MDMLSAHLCVKKLFNGHLLVLNKSRNFDKNRLVWMP